MKSVLILVLSCEDRPYGKMVDTSKVTWDSVSVDGCETVYYFGNSRNKRSDLDCLYLPVDESLHNMGEKTIQALEWAINNKDFDYIARVNSSCYVSKKKLINYVQALPESNLFEGLVCKREAFDYVWGGGQYIISRDVVKKLVEEKAEWNHRHIEDESMSLLASDNDIPFRDGNACSINKTGNGWALFSYGFGESIEFSDFKETINTPHYFFRVKQDGKRELDEYIMNELYKNNT